jgi:hypothetical protein
LCMIGYFRVLPDCVKMGCDVFNWFVFAVVDLSFGYY